MSEQKPYSLKEIDTTRLNPQEELFVKIERIFDPYAATTSMLNAYLSWVMHPLEFRRAMKQISADIAALYIHIGKRLMGLPSPGVAFPHSDDIRFQDPVWTESPTWDIIKSRYLMWTHRLQDMIYETPGISNKGRRHAAFWARHWLNAIAPTNFFWTNPVAMRHFVETNGESILKGMQNFAKDFEANDIRMTDTDAFKVGQNLATTEGSVVFRNKLFELIHYKPTTDKVHKTPLLFITPWINKYYVLDLTPKKSMVKYLTDKGFSVFITSWKNPSRDMAETTFDDYLISGIHQAINTTLDFCGVEKVNLVGYCIGGTLVTAYMAWANHKFSADKFPIKTWTLFASLTDFSIPGDIEVFIDEPSLAKIEEGMEKKGYLDGKEMSLSFRMLRANSLIWNYVVDGYLLGKSPKPFDVLYWNMDSTRMPKAMHSYYLRNMYLKNLLIKKNALTIAGEPIDLDLITQPLYMVTARDDHIAPCLQCSHLRRYINIQVPMRFVLSSSGHILGIVNPPVSPPKRHYQVDQFERNEQYKDWCARVPEQAGSWWDDWLPWLQQNSGSMVSAYPVSNERYPQLDPAPGRYVLEP